MIRPARPAVDYTPHWMHRYLDTPGAPSWYVFIAFAGVVYVLIVWGLAVLYGWGVNAIQRLRGRPPEFNGPDDGFAH